MMCHMILLWVESAMTQIHQYYKTEEKVNFMIPTIGKQVMEDYQAKPFAGEWNEDPKNFLGWFLICMGSADDNTKVHQFIYYLQANSDADEWYKELLEEGKGSWASIEKLFHRRWLKEEEISIKESVTSENKPQLVFPVWFLSLFWTRLGHSFLGKNRTGLGKTGLHRSGEMLALGLSSRNMFS